MDLATPMTATPALAFDELLLRHRGIVHKVAAGYARGAEDRADLAQEIAMQLWRAWPSYDPARSFSTWMYRIALNTAISHLRAQAPASRDVPLDGHADALVAEGAFDPETHERLGLLRRFMATLGPLDRALLLLYLEERSGREMAEVLGIGQSNVSTRINRIRQRLRDYAAARFQD
ncbi:MAG: sigma-70 family RNA polymerase sigma factor [Xanthomonadales bacterium]|nr:sigma-70 family RNA polymerase sigma factor [Achromobacter sp.]MDZ3799085.1 sigma-70 family RNA polymerase sigma factor [Xanthomonadales bacterium]